MSQAFTGGKPLSRALCAILGTLALTAVSPVRATRSVDIYRVSVPAGSLAAEVQAAMQQVLVRATGRLDAPADPALAPLLTHAGQYVLSVSEAENGAVQVAFNGPAVADQIVAAHRSVWDVDRPFTIVVLAPPPTGAADNEARQSLDQIALGRGLPIALVPLSVTDASGQALSDGALLDAAERLGGDAVLVGRAEAAQPGAEATQPSGAAQPGAGAAQPSGAAQPGAGVAQPSGAAQPGAGVAQPSGAAQPGAEATQPSGTTQPSDEWHWTLVTGISSQSWDGTFADGINQATDALAQAQGSSIPLGIQAADVAVEGVQTLADYAAVEQMLADLPGAQSSGLVEADGTTATFRVLIRGGALAVESALAHSQRLERTGTADAPIEYRLHP